MKPLPFVAWCRYYRRIGKRWGCRDCARTWKLDAFAVRHAVAFDHAIETIEDLHTEALAGPLFTAPHRYMQAVGGVCWHCQVPREVHDWALVAAQPPP